jgi:hypothetical protein
MFKVLRYTFLVHGIITALLGAVLLIIPGRFLEWIGWLPVEPLLTRVLGSALLALAWGSLARGWWAGDRVRMSVLLEIQAAFHVLACAGLLRHLLIANYPAMVWIVFAVLAVFGVIWVVGLFITIRQGRATGKLASAS